MLKNFVNNLLQYLHIFFNICIFVVEELVSLMGLKKCCKKLKLSISNNILFKCLQCKQYFTKAWNSICHIRILHNNAHLFICSYYFYLLQYILFFHLQITVKKHTLVCKACNSYVHNTNDMTQLHLNKCFNGKFNDDVKCSSIENYLYCFSCKTITPIHNNFDDV